MQKYNTEEKEWNNIFVLVAFYRAIKPSKKIENISSYEEIQKFREYGNSNETYFIPNDAYINIKNFPEFDKETQINIKVDGNLKLGHFGINDYYRYNKFNIETKGNLKGKIYNEGFDLNIISGGDVDLQFVEKTRTIYVPEPIPANDRFQKISAESKGNVSIYSDISDINLVDININSLKSTVLKNIYTTLGSSKLSSEENIILNGCQIHFIHNNNDLNTSEQPHTVKTSDITAKKSIFINGSNIKFPSAYRNDDITSLKPLKLIEGQVFAAVFSAARITAEDSQLNIATEFYATNRIKLSGCTTNHNHVLTHSSNEQVIILNPNGVEIPTDHITSQQPDPKKVLLNALTKIDNNLQDFALRITR